jgi:hypothetical protein
MAHSTKSIEVYLETGQTRTFAVALDWPGWCRSGRDQDGALQALYEYGPRYARVLQRMRLSFQAPSKPENLVVVEQQAGNATTDFGAPALALPSDTKPISPAELQRFQKVLKACWRALDTAAQAADGHKLRKGPRGGGRDVAKIMEHVRDVDAAYLTSLGGKLEPGDKNESSQELAHVRKAILATLISAAHGEVPERGPRGGIRWTPRYFVRRLAWHELDHAWEIEDRAE